MKIYDSLDYPQDYPTLAQSSAKFASERALLALVRRQNQTTAHSFDCAQGFGGDCTCGLYNAAFAEGIDND